MGWRRADRGRRRAGTQGCHGAFSRRRFPPGRGTTPPRCATRAETLRLPPPGRRSGVPARRSGCRAKTLRRRRGDSPRAGGSSSAPPAGCSALAPRPMATVSSGDSAWGPRRLPEAQPAAPARTRPLGARLPAPCHVGAWPRPPLTLTPLETSQLLRFQGRAGLRLPAARGVPRTLT